MTDRPRRTTADTLPSGKRKMGDTFFDERERKRAVAKANAWTARQAAYADFYGKDIGVFDLGFMFAVEGCGHNLKPTLSGAGFSPHVCYSHVRNG